MLNIALISSTPEDAGSPPAIYTLALASIMNQRGHSVSIICPNSGSPRSAYSCDGTLTTHRLNLRRGSMPHAFVVQACQRIWECGQANPFDVIQCVDAPSAIPALLAMRLSGMMNSTIASCTVDPQQHDHPLGTTQTAMADVVFRVSPHDFACAHDRQMIDIPFPLSPERWNPPGNHVGPLLIAYDTLLDSKRALIIEAFKQSGVSDLGWSLAMLNADGRWTVLSGTKCNQATQSRQRIVIASGHAAPIIPFSAFLLGNPCIVSDQTPVCPEHHDVLEPYRYQESDLTSLAQTIKRVIEQPLSSHDACINEIANCLQSKHSSASIIDRYEQAWNNAKPVTQTTHQLDLWKQLETPSTSHSTHTLCIGAL